MKQRTKLSQEQQHAVRHLTSQHTEREFATVEELLRFDAAQTDVPPEVAKRLSRSARETPPTTPSPARPWWKNLFGQ